VEFTFRRKVALGATALAAVAFAGGAFAATQDSATNQRQAFINDVAKRLNVSPQQVTDALKGAWSDRLDAAVKAGKLTQAQANELKQRIQQHGGPPFGFFGPHQFGFKRGGGPLMPAATYLGLTPAQLAEQLSQGKSLAQIAQSKGKSVAGLKTELVAAERAHLDQALKNKMITAAEEQQILSRQSSRLDELINRKGAPFRFGFHHRFGPGPGAAPGFGFGLDRRGSPPNGAALPAPPPNGGAVPAPPAGGATLEGPPPGAPPLGY
jgi:hypothetical protein